MKFNIARTINGCHWSTNKSNNERLYVQYEIYEKTREAGAEYRLAYVPDELNADHHDMFEPEAMKKMFDKAFSMAVEGYPWLMQPPDVL